MYWAKWGGDRSISILDNLPHLATAKRRTRTKDSLGGMKDSFTTVLFTDRACWRQPATSSEIKEWQQRSVEVSHKIYFTSDPGVDGRDVLVVGGDTMSVRSAAHPDASVGLGVLCRVMVRLEPVPA